MLKTNITNRLDSELRLTFEVLQLTWEAAVARQGAALANLNRSIAASYQMAHSWHLLTIASETAREVGWMNIHMYLAEHANEESSHFVWAISDIANSSRSVALKHLDYTKCEVPISIRDMIGRQYLYIRSPKGISKFFGYIVALEGFPALPGTWEKWCFEHGISEDEAQSPIRHSIADQCHGRDLFSFIEESTVLDEAEIVEEARSCLIDITKMLLR